jgi:hypothetical protein
MEPCSSSLSLPSMEDDTSFLLPDKEPSSLELLARIYHDDPNSKLRASRTKCLSGLALDWESPSSRNMYDRPPFLSENGACGKIRGEHGEMEDLSADNASQRLQRIQSYMGEERGNTQDRSCSETSTISGSSPAPSKLGNVSLDKVKRKLGKLLSMNN